MPLLAYVVFFLYIFEYINVENTETCIRFAVRYYIYMCIYIYLYIIVLFAVLGMYIVKLSYCTDQL